MVIVIRKPAHKSPELQEVPAAHVELSLVTAPVAIEKNRLNRMEVIRNHLQVIGRELPRATKAAGREYGRGRATLRAEALEEDQRKLRAELKRLSKGK
jgi:hypothetical protein